MNLTKKFIALLLSILTLTLLCFSAVSCDTDGGADTTVADNGGESNAPTDNDSTTDGGASDATTAVAESGYTVNVVDDNFNPVEGAHVQLCSGENCQMPIPTDADGKVVFDVEDGDYYIKIVMVPAGFEAIDSIKWYFDEGSKTMTVNLTAAQ